MPSSPAPYLVLVLALLATGCAVPQLSATPRYAYVSLEGDLLARDTTNLGTAVTSSDLESMGLDESEGAPGGRIDFKWGSPHLIVQGIEAEFSGTGTATGTLTSNGVTISGGLPVATDFDYSSVSGLLVFDVIPTKTVDLGLGFGVNMLDVDFTLTQGANVITTDESLPVPVLAANGSVQVGDLELGLLLSGLSISVDDGEGTILDADASLRWRWFGGKNHARTSFILGWRQTDLDIEYDDGADDFEADIEMSGPYFGIQITL